MNTAIKASIEKLSKEEMLKAAEEIKKRSSKLIQNCAIWKNTTKKSLRRKCKKAQEELKYLKNRTRW